MLAVRDIMFCMGVTHSPELGVTAHALTDVIRPKDVTASITFATIVSLMGIEPGQEYKLKVRIIDPNMDEIASTEGMLPPKPMTSIPVEHQGIQCALTWQNVVLNTSGVFTIQVYVDGDIMKVQEFYVAETAPREMAPTKAN